MILDLDIGNTWIKWRFGDRFGQLLTAELNQSRFLKICAEQNPERVRLATVACERQQELIGQWALQGWGVTVEVAKTAAVAGGVTNSYQQSARMGVDRWLAMMAAYNFVSGACCVVDCGSAITVDYVDSKGMHLGGYIIPGLRLMRLGLLSNTRRVLSPESVETSRSTSPGNSTEEAVDHGISLLFESLALRIVSEYPGVVGPRSRLIVTGGDAERFVDIVGGGELSPCLVLDGLAFALP